jgi:methionine synthase II (cobalamin-independent)
MQKPEITKDIYIEDLVDNYPFSVKFLMQKGIRCIMCGEPIWGTLEEASKEKDFTENEILTFVEEMKKLAIEQ